MLKKLLENKLLLVFLSLLLLGLGVVVYVRELNYQDFYVDFNNDTFIIDTTGVGNYFSIRAQDDIVDNFKDFTEKPFSDKAESDLESEGINFAGYNKTYTLTTEELGNTRVLTAKRISAKVVRLNIKTDTDYKRADSKYLFVLGSAANIITVNNSDEYIVEAGKCELRLPKQDGIIYREAPFQDSIFIEIPYQDSSEVELIITVNCS